MNAELFINDEGRFQLPSEELAGFAAYLRENEVPCDVEEAGTFRAEGRSYGFGRLHHLYDLRDRPGPVPRMAAGGGSVVGPSETALGWEISMIHFFQELDRLTADLLGLAGMVEESIRDALRALDERRPDLARRVIDADAAIDREEVRIEEECVRILVLSSPVAGDMRRVIAVLNIDNDLERIADLAVDIAEEAQALAGRPDDLPIAGSLGAMADRALQMVRDSLNAFVGSDVALARAVLAMDDEVDRLDRASREEALALIRADPGRADAALRMFSVARHLERIADHATNIAEDMVYLKEGAIIRHRAEPG